MTSCSLFASGLVSEFNGATPTFSYHKTNHQGDYFGVQLTYLRGTSTCFQPGAIAQVTPVIRNDGARFSEECVFKTSGTTYTGIFCPDAAVTDIPNGPLTVTYNNLPRGQPTPIPFVALFGPSPAPQTVTATANALASSTSTFIATASPAFASTATVYAADATQTQTTTVYVTQTQTTTNTNYVSSCSTSRSSSSSSSASSSSASSSSASSSSASSSSASSSSASSSPASSSSTSRGSSSSTSASSSSVSPSSASSSSASSISTSTSTKTSTATNGPVATSSVVCPASDGQTINTSAGTFIVECGIDHAGGDMSKSPVYTGSYEGCIAACAGRDGCLDVSYIPNGPCYLKSAVGAAIKNSNIIGGRLLGSRSASSATGTITTSSAAVTTPPSRTITVTTTVSGTGYQCACKPTTGPGASLDCPSSNGTTYTSDCGATYAIECSADRYGDDIPGGAASAYSLNECIIQCDNTQGCIDVSYVFGSPGTCYKKSAIAAIRQDDNIYGARRLTACKATPKIKLHRKRVVQEPAESKHVQKRGVYGPDFTYTQGSTTVTKTATSTTVYYTTATVTPAPSGTTTKTVYTTATRSATVTNAGATVTHIQQTTVTTCPAVTKRAVL